MFVMALVYGLGVGATVMWRSTPGDRQPAPRLAARTVPLIGVAATLVLWLRRDPVLVAGAARFMAADGRLLALTLEYLHVTLVSVRGVRVPASDVFHLPGRRATHGRRSRPLVGVNVLHVLLAIPLIFGVWGFRARPWPGAALASAFSEGVGRRGSCLRPRGVGFFGAGDRVGSPQELWRTLRVGLPAMGERPDHPREQVV